MCWTVAVRTSENASFTTFGEAHRTQKRRSGSGRQPGSKVLVWSSTCGGARTGAYDAAIASPQRPIPNRPEHTFRPGARHPHIPTRARSVSKSPASRERIGTPDLL